MKAIVTLLLSGILLSGCSTSSMPSQDDLANSSTNDLCRIVTGNPDFAYRQKAADLLIKRGATLERCQQLIAADNAMITGIAIAGVAVAAGAAAHNGYGVYQPSPAYGVAWDQFYNNGYVMWRCRDRYSGQFVADYQCAGLPMHDGTWPGP